MQQINYEEFYNEFITTKIGKQVVNDFTEVTCKNNHRPSILEVAKRYGSTCREMLGNANLVPENNFTSISIVTFFYLQFLLEKNPETIYDIGCGWNIWKRYIPNIVGIDHRDNSKADIIDEYNDQFIINNYQKFDAAFSVNMNSSLKKNAVTQEQVSTTFENLGECLRDFASIIKPGGRGYLSLPVIGLLHFTPQEWYDQYQMSPYHIHELAAYTKQHILDQGLKIIALDIELDFIRNIPSHDGEIRIVFEV